jgi:hypothetical protein
MKQLNVEIIEQKDVNRFTYKNIMPADLPEDVLFRHTDQSVNKALVFSSGGYISLSVVADKPREVSSVDRRAMFRNRRKPNLPGQEWSHLHQPKEAGWKFHLSIAQDPANLEKAWDALVPILLKYKVGQTKIVHEKNLQEASKVITVFTFSGGPQLDQWSPFIKDVELAFREHGIRPGEKIFEYQIIGSQYFYYRNDAGHKGEYIKDEYNFLYKIVDQIPLSKEQELKFASELKENPNNVGCIVKLKGSDVCCLYVKDRDGWDRQEFNIALLKNIENPDQDHRISVAPILNRPAYLELVVPRLERTILSTNNVTKEQLPFKDIDLNRELAHVLPRDIGQSNKSPH